VSKGHSPTGEHRQRDKSGGHCKKMNVQVKALTSWRVRGRDESGHGKKMDE